MRKLFFFLFIIPLLGLSQNPLLIPDTLSGDTINLSLLGGQVDFHAGIPTNTIGYNQDILGPTLILRQGRRVNMNVTNTLAKTTTLHWHGLHVSAENDGGPHSMILSGQTWSPSFTVLDHAATYWYHPHLHEHTEEQVTQGGAGLIIVKDAAEAQLALPRTYGVDDIPLVIQSRAFDANKQFKSGTPMDTSVLCNATMNAELDVPGQFIRFRLLNGSTERVYNLGFAGNLNFYQIATDGGLLDAPVRISRLMLSPGERAEIMVNLASQQGLTAKLMSFGSELANGIYGAANPSAMPRGTIPGYSNNPLNGNNFTILRLNVGAPNANAITAVPAALITNNPYPVASADTTRVFEFRPKQMSANNMVNGPFVINNASFDMQVINETIAYNNTEIWEFTNRTGIAHPFHIHDVQFFILDINGTAPAANMRGRKDVVLVPARGGTARFITKFEDFAKPAGQGIPYMYHCHMLSHEDAGMMGQFIVVGNPPPTAIDGSVDESISIYPNPTSNSVKIKSENTSIIELFSPQGQSLKTIQTQSGEARFDLSGYTSGVYYFKITNSKSSRTYKIVKN